METFCKIMRQASLPGSTAKSNSEMFIFRRRGNRKDMIIGTKVRLYKEDIFNPDPKQPNSHGLSRKHILEAVEWSLKRLQTDYIDLYQVYPCVFEAIVIVIHRTFSCLFHIFTTGKSAYLDIA